MSFTRSSFNWRSWLGCLLLLGALESFAVAAPVTLFYIGSGPESVRDFLAHSSQIDLAVPTWYQVDDNGLVTGGPEPLVYQRAKAENVPLMPLIALFNKQKFHTLASSAEAQKQMNDKLLADAAQFGYVGYQFDFEDIDYRDRDLLSAVVKTTADVLHAHGLKLTIATVPNAPGGPGNGSFNKWMWTDWRGAYDLAAIGKSVDLVCLMTYDQHTRWTMPGPVAGWQWTVDNVNYALRFVPKEKLSLGIPVYGYHWYTDGPIHDKDEDKPSHGAAYIGAPNAMLLAQSYKAQIQWDEQDRTAYFWFYRDQMREWVFYTDKRTFEERYNLVKQLGLEGFCSWVLGEEDPAIWTVLPKRN